MHLEWRCRWTALAIGFGILLSAGFAAPAAEIETHPPIPIRFHLPEDAWVTLTIDDANGRRVRNLVAETQFQKGDNVVWWDGTDDLLRDPDAYRHGVYSIPPEFVAPGSYRVQGLYRKAIDLHYEFSLYAAGHPAWEIEDRTGAWLANHTPPSAVLFDHHDIFEMLRGARPTK